MSFPWKLNRYSYRVQFGINCTALGQSKLSNIVECTIIIMIIIMMMMMIMVHHCQRTDEYMYVISVELELLFLLRWPDRLKGTKKFV